MGRVAGCVVVVVLWSFVVVSAASADSPFVRPASATRELVGERTAQSRTWVMPSGRHVTQLASGPVQWKDEKGDWHDFDLGLSKSGAGWTGEAGPLSIDLPQQLDRSADGAVRVADGAGNSLAMTLLGDSAVGEVAGDVATYRGVLDGVDVRLRVTPEGLKEDVVLKDRDAARDLVYRVTLGSDDLVLEETDGGGVRAMRGEDRVFRLPAPSMVDANGAVARDGRFEVAKVGPRTWEVAAKLDQKWLDGKDREWPVVVDPSVLTFQASATDDCQVLAGSDFSSSWSCNTGATRIGGHYASGGVGYFAAALLRFNTFTLVQSDAIDSAQLKLYRTASNAPSTPLNVYRINTQWDASTPFANPGWWEEAPVAHFDTGPVGPIQTDMTNIVTEWRRYSTSGGAHGVPNYGVALMHLDHFYPWDCISGTCDQTTIASSQNSDPAKRPILEVKSWPAAAAGNAVISPQEGQLTGKRVKLQAKALASSVSTVRFQYIAGSQRTWTDIPVGALQTPTRGSVASTFIPVSGPTGDRRSDLVVWDVSAMPGGDVDGPVHVRAWLESPTAGDGGMTDEVNFRLDRRGEGEGSSSVGPGELDLLSGEFSMSEQDVSFENFLQNLTLTRTYRSRGVAVRNADMFGSGWEANVEADGGDLPYKGIYDYSEVTDVAVERQVLDPSSWNWELFSQTFNFEDLDADIETVQETERFDTEYAIVEAADGTKMTFTKVGAGGQTSDWEPDDLHPGYTLSRATTGTTGIFEFTLTDPDGSVAKFLSEATNSPNYRLSTFQQPGSPGALSYTYEASGTRQRLKSATGPTPTGGTPRSLQFTWSDVGSPAVPRVTAVAVQDGTSTPTTVATYSYDGNARLIQVTDPRIGGSVRKTLYHYNAGGQLDQITPPGEAAWNLTYTTASGDAGPRLSTVSRAHPDGGTATSTILYAVPLSGSGAPYDMSTSETAKWGETDDLPWDAVAIFPEDTTPSGNPPDYSKATIYYVGLQGNTVNVARPGGAISTFEHDASGNVIQSLSAKNRGQALAAGVSSASVAQDLSTLYSYASNGVDLVATKEPQTQIKLSDGSTVTGRRVQAINYDENAPSGGPYHLVTSRFRAVETTGGQVDVKEKVRYDYGANGGMSGWTARQPTKTIVDPGGKGLTSYSILHPTYPVVEETRTPGGAGGGNTPDVQYYQYYKIAPSSRVPTGIVSTQCSGGSSYASGRLCMRSEGTTPTASVQRRWFTYSLYGHVATIAESKTLSQSGTSYRRTSYGYDTDDQLTSELVAGGGGTATPWVTHTYNATTGKETQTRNYDPSTFALLGTITRAFDSNGRLSQYTDGNGTSTVYHYDLRGRQTSAIEGGTRTISYGYDDRDNLTSLTDPDVGSAINAGYDTDDNLVSEVLPNDLALTESYDETGRPSQLLWTKTAGCSSNCVWAKSQVTSRDADGNIAGQMTNNTQETLSQDSAERLSTSDAVRLSDNRCVRRTYAYDGGGAGDSNRTSTSVWTSAPGANCGTGTPVTRTLTNDSADRINATGWIWDEFGRATSVPASDSGGTGALTAAYYSNNRVRQLVLDSRTHTYTRDPLMRTKSISSSGAGKPTLTTTYRYSDDTDEPSSIGRSDGTTERDIQGPSGMLVAVKDDGTLTYQLRDIQGNIVATTQATGTPDTASEYDPFGIVTTPPTNVITWTKGLPANGWLGAHQRATDFGQTAAGVGGPVEMGVRVYLPKVGRFLQPDPVDGGSANAYDYAFQSPANYYDLDGQKGGPGTGCGAHPQGCRAKINYLRNLPNHGPTLGQIVTAISNKIAPLKIAFNIGKCAFKLAKSRGEDPSSCNSF